MRRHARTACRGNLTDAAAALREQRKENTRLLARLDALERKVAEGAVTNVTQNVVTNVTQNVTQNVTIRFGEEEIGHFDAALLKRLMDRLDWSCDASQLSKDLLPLVQSEIYAPVPEKVTVWMTAPRSSYVHVSDGRGGADQIPIQAAVPAMLDKMAAAIGKGLEPAGPTCLAPPERQVACAAKRRETLDEHRRSGRLVGGLIVAQPGGGHPLRA